MGSIQPSDDIGLRRSSSHRLPPAPRAAGGYRDRAAIHSLRLPAMAPYGTSVPSRVRSASSLPAMQPSPRRSATAWNRSFEECRSTVLCHPAQGAARSGGDTTHVLKRRGALPLPVLPARYRRFLAGATEHSAHRGHRAADSKRLRAPEPDHELGRERQSTGQIGFCHRGRTQHADVLLSGVPEVFWRADRIGEFVHLRCPVEDQSITHSTREPSLESVT